MARRANGPKTRMKRKLSRDVVFGDLKRREEKGVKTKVSKDKGLIGVDHGNVVPKQAAMVNAESEKSKADSAIAVRENLTTGKSIKRQGLEKCCLIYAFDRVMIRWNLPLRSCSF